MCERYCYHLTTKTDEETGDDYYWCSATNRYTEPLEDECSYQED